MFAVLVAVAALASSVSAQNATSTPAATAASPAFTPLASKSFTWGDLPYKADPSDGGPEEGDRGPQSGYNICNSTTEGPNSQCQTLVINSLSDFCLWGPPVPNSDVGDTEGQSVAWCTLPGHGTRVIPSGAITGAQWLDAPAYVEIVGFIQQDLIDMDPNDGGGEMDPHGADQRGNPIGALVFSNAFPQSAGNPNDYIQVKEWHNFMGSGVFCFKACNPNNPLAPDYCQHLFDRIGCEYNAPAAYVDNIFESCLSDNQQFPGVYVGSNGQTTTYVQPPESLGPISTMPYTAVIPASSSCTTYSSAQLYSGQPSPTTALTGTMSASTSAPTVSNAVTNVGVPGGKTTAATSTSTAKSGAESAVKLTGVWTVAVGIVGAVLGAVIAL